MDSVRACALPEAALLAGYRGRGFTDCYATELPMRVSHADYVGAFYTSPLFKVERLLLAWFASRPCTDAQARQLAQGSATTFAAWNVEGREADQLLLADMTGRTRSWLMTQPLDAGGTRLYFGSAVVPGTGRSTMGWQFRALLGFHKLYSRALLRAARARLAQ